MTRFERKNRTDIIYKGCGGLTDAFDDVVKDMWRINDAEYDFISETATDEELDMFIPKISPSISELKQGIKFVNEILVKFNELQNNSKKD